MNKVFLAVLFGSFILTGTSFAQSPATPPATTPAVAATEPAESAEPAEHSKSTKPSHHEHHVMISKAISKLKSVRHELERAAHEYGGHKAKAIGAIDHAIEELQAAIDSEKK